MQLRAKLSVVLIIARLVVATGGRAHPIRERVPSFVETHRLAVPDERAAIEAAIGTGIESEIAFVIALWDRIRSPWLKRAAVRRAICPGGRVDPAKKGGTSQGSGTVGSCGVGASDCELWAVLVPSFFPSFVRYLF